MTPPRDDADRFGPPPATGGGDSRAPWAQPDGASPGFPPAAPPPGAPAPTDPEPERFHPAYMLMTMVRSFRGFIIPIAFALFSGSRGEFLWLGIAAAFAGLTVVNAVATWWFSSYQVTETTLRLRTGWLNRQERSVAFERIQTIDLQEPPLARALGVAQLRVETAASGGGAADIVVEAIARDEAVALRNELLAERARHTGRAAPAGSAPADGDRAFAAAGDPAATGPAAGSGAARDLSGEPGTVLGRLSTRDLLIAGMTSGRIGPAAAILAALTQFGGDTIENVAVAVFGDRAQDVFDAGLSASITAILGVVLVLGLVAWGLAIFGTVLAFSGFTLRRDGDELYITTGLLDRRRTTIPLHRIQSITVKDGLLRQPFGLASLHFVSAGYGGGEQSNDSGVLFPLVRQGDIPALLAAAAPAFATDVVRFRAEGNRLPGRALPRYLVPAIAWDVAAIAVAIVLAWLIPVTPWWVGFAAILIASTPWTYLSYRDSRWGWDGDRLVIQGRTIVRSVTVIPQRRVQFREVRQNPFQRRARLATLAIRVAGTTFGNSATITHLDAGDATAIADRLALTNVPRRQPRRARRRQAMSDAPVAGFAPASAWDAGRPGE
jgi:putative membrane protein